MRSLHEAQRGVNLGEVSEGDRTSYRLRYMMYMFSVGRSRRLALKKNPILFLSLFGAGQRGTKGVNARRPKIQFKLLSIHVRVMFWLKELCLTRHILSQHYRPSFVHNHTILFQLYFLPHHRKAWQFYRIISAADLTAVF